MLGNAWGLKFAKYSSRVGGMSCADPRVLRANPRVNGVSVYDSESSPSGESCAAQLELTPRSRPRAKAGRREKRSVALHRNLFTGKLGHVAQRQCS